jgi:hypothetical protein
VLIKPEVLLAEFSGKGECSENRPNSRYDEMVFSEGASTKVLSEILVHLELLRKTSKNVNHFN